MIRRFAPSYSSSFRIAAWLFLVALFADAANLDDLLFGPVVVHDDDEVAAASLGAGGESESTLHTVRPRCTVERCGPISSPLQRTLVRLIIDQDSPSLAATELPFICTPLRFSAESGRSAIEPPLPQELLHIRFRTLLI